MGLYPQAAEFALTGVPRGKNSQVFVVDPTYGSDSNNGKSFALPLATIPAALALCTANQNDVVLYVAGSSSITLSAALDWNKDYTHLIGLCAPTNTAQRARIFQLSTLTGASPLITVSASGCMFKDLYIFQGVNDATSLINVSVTGGRNYFKNVHFAGGGHAAQAIDAGASLSLSGCEENLFEDCTVGVDTIGTATGYMSLLFTLSAKRNMFKGCLFRQQAGHTAAGFAEVMLATGIALDNTFVNCLFLNNSTTAMASAFVIPASVAGSAHIFLKDCMFSGVTKLDASDRGVLFGNMNAVTGADLSGVAVQLIT